MGCKGARGQGAVRDAKNMPGENQASASLLVGVFFLNFTLVKEEAADGEYQDLGEPEG